jgi:hypothetical protein
MDEGRACKRGVRGREGRTSVLDVCDQGNYLDTHAHKGTPCLRRALCGHHLEILDLFCKSSLIQQWTVYPHTFCFPTSLGQILGCLLLGCCPLLWQGHGTDPGWARLEHAPCCRATARVVRIHSTRENHIKQQIKITMAGGERHHRWKE